MYLPLLEKFANGVNAGEIMEGKSINDITKIPQECIDDIKKKARAIATASGASPDAAEAEAEKAVTGTAAFPYYEIKSKMAIFATMATAIKNIVTSKKPGATPILNFAENDLLNVSEYMKDLMTAYLPMFDKELNILCSKIDLIKNLIENVQKLSSQFFQLKKTIVSIMV